MTAHQIRTRTAALGDGRWLCSHAWRLASDGERATHDAGKLLVQGTVVYRIIERE